MRFMRRVMALLMTLVLLCPAAVAEVSFLQHAADWALEDMPLEIQLSADVQAHTPYDETRLAMLQGVLKPLKLRLLTQGDDSAVTVIVGATEAVELRQCGTSLQASCMPGVVYSAAEDPMGLLLGSNTEEFSVLGMRGEAETLLQDGLVLLKALMAEMEDAADRRKVKTAIENMGTARSCTDFTVSKDKAEELTDTLLRLCPEGWLRQIISGLTFSGKQTLRVYRTEDDVPLRMEYNGTCGPEGDLRTVKLVWRMRRDDTAHRDEVTLTSPAKTGGNKNTLEFGRVITTNRQGAVEMQGSFTYTVTADRQTTTRKGEFDLTNAFTDAADVLTGEVTLQQRLPGEDSFSGLTVAPEITIAGTNDAPVVTGFVTVSSLKGQNVLDSARITLDLRRCEAFPWESREESIDLDLLTEEELAALQGDVATGVAASLVRPLILLLGDSAEWFFRDLLPEQVQRINDAARQVVNE